MRLVYTYKLLDSVFYHAHDKTTDLTIHNGRVKGAVWLLEEMKKPNKTRFLKWIEKHRNPKRFCDGRFVIIGDDHALYCLECGGKIVKALENQTYSVMEYACSSCGLVLEA